MPFFIRGRGKKLTQKRRPLKRNASTVTKNDSNLPPSKKGKKFEDDEEITSDEDDAGEKNISNNRVEEVEETPQEKRIRLAAQFLEELKNQKKAEAEEEGGDGDDVLRSIGHQLKEDVLEAAGKLQRSVANTYDIPDINTFRVLKCKHQKLTLTCHCISHDEKHIFTASKDCCIVKWSIEGQRVGIIPRITKSKEERSKGHSSHILSLAISTDGNFLASGDCNAILHIWNANSLQHLHTFRKHRGPISGLTFRKGTNMLYSASHDRMVIAWNLDEMAFTESLGGHQDAITGIDALSRESCITSGGRDESVIIYVIPEEKQLRFHSSQCSVDGVKLINEKTFITYGLNGSLAFWTTMKKKPHFIVNAAHGRDPESGEPYWMTSVAALLNTDLIASGSSDGFVKLWKINYGKRRLEALFSVPVTGVVNSLEFTSSGSHLIAAVGQEHKLGRWFTVKSAKNSIVIIPLNKIS